MKLRKIMSYLTGVAFYGGIFCGTFNNAALSCDMDSLSEKQSSEQYKPHIAIKKNSKQQGVLPLFIENESLDAFTSEGFIDIEKQEDTLIKEFVPSEHLERIQSVEEDIYSEKIKSYVDRYIDKDQELSDKTWKRVTRIGLKILAGIIGGTAGFPFIESACNAGKDYHLCIPFATGTVIAYGSAATWVGLHLVSKLDPTSEEELYFEETSGNSKISRHIAINFLGILSSIPDIYSVYEYNTMKWLVVPAFIVSYTFKTQGYYELQKKLEAVFTALSDVGKSIKIDNARESIVIHNNIIPSLLDCDQNSLDEKKNEIIKKLIILLNPNHQEALLDQEEILDIRKEKGRIVLRKLTQTAGLMFPIGNVLVNGIFAYSAMRLLTDSPWLCYPGTILMVTPGFVLDAVISTLTIGEIYDTIYNVIQQRSERSFFTTMHPMLRKGLPLICLTLSALAAAGDAYVAHDKISHSSLSSLKSFLPWMVFGANTIFETYTGVDLFKSFITQGYKYCGSQYNSMKLKLIERLEVVASFFENRNVFRAKQDAQKEDEGLVLSAYEASILVDTNDRRINIMPTGINIDELYITLY